MASLLGRLGNDMGVGNGSIAEVVVVGSWGSSSMGISQGWGSNWSSNWSVVVSHSRGGNSNGGGHSDGLLVDVGLGSNLDINVRLGSDVSVHIGLSGDVLMDVGLGGDVLVNVGLSGDLLMDIRLGGDLGIDVGLSGDVLVDLGLGSGVEVGVGYRWVDSSVNSGQRGSSVSHGLGSDGGGVAISIGGSSVASGVASI